MKLIFCPDCHDVFKLIPNKVRHCDCGKCKGKLVDKINAVYNEGIPLGFYNPSLGMACANQPIAGWGRRFEAFVIPKNADTLVKTDNID